MVARGGEAEAQLLRRQAVLVPDVELLGRDSQGRKNLLKNLLKCNFDFQICLNYSNFFIFPQFNKSQQIFQQIFQQVFFSCESRPRAVDIAQI